MGDVAEYREIGPSARFAESIECFWTIEANSPSPLHRVMPDGCADILFTQEGSRGRLEAVGAMTMWRDYPLPAGQRIFGVRFRPGMWRENLCLPGNRMTDAIVALEDLWGTRAREVAQHLGECAGAEQCAAVLEGVLTPARAIGFNRTMAWMAERRGMVSMDEIARQAGLSARQFRRVCLEQTGLTPKFLARVLRFRHALARLARHQPLVEVALDCGYYDQAHCINEFRELAGRTPAALQA